MVIMSIPFQKGEMALICRGPFAGKRGTITRIDAGSVTVMCDVFDRDTASRSLSVMWVRHQPPERAATGNSALRCPLRVQREQRTIWTDAAG
jgi:hypothetical protein